MQKRTLQADDFAVGQFVAIKECRSKTSEQDMGPVAVLNMVSSKWSSLKGEALKIVAIELPYLSVNVMMYQGSRAIPVDTREVDLIEISREFAMSMRPRPRWKFWKR